MPAAEISVIVESNTEDSVSVQGFLDAVSHTLEILRNLDSAISLRRTGTLRWVISELHSESPATARLRAVPSSEDQDFSYDVIRSYLDGLEQLSTGNALPKDFPEDALESAKRLSRDMVKENIVILFRHQERTVEVSERIATNVDERLSQTYFATGSVEGTLEMVTVHDRSYFRVYDTVHGMGVPCYFNSDLLEHVRQGIGHRVSVQGDIQSDRNGKIRSLSVNTIRLLPDEGQLPTPSQMRGLVKGISEGRPAEEYLRDLRDEAR